MRNFSFTRDGNFFLVSDSGKIRVYDARGGTLHREFVDLVNRTQWRKCGFSADGNYVLGATSESGKHEIYVWSRDNGNLIIHLKGPMSSVLDLQWHPARPIIASTSQSGNVMVWSKQYSENYSAFAPNFKELEENEEYIERGAKHKPISSFFEMKNLHRWLISPSRFGKASRAHAVTRGYLVEN